MQPLPKWVLTNPRPGVYDTESGTAADMTAKVYNAMAELIEEYNAFADSVNSTLGTFTGSETEARKDFEENIINLYREFQCQMDSYLRLNLGDTATKVIIEGMNDGAIPVPTDPTLKKPSYPAEAAATGAAIEVQKKRIDSLVRLPDGSTTNDAALQDICIAYDSRSYETPGEAVRTQAKTAADRISAIKENPIKKTIDLTNGFADISLSYEDLTLLYTGQYIADDASEQTAGTWSIYQYEFTGRTLVKIESISSNPNISGVALGAYYDGVKNTRIFAEDAGKMFVAQSLKFNFWNEIEELAFSEVKIKIFAVPQFEHAITCRGKIGQCDKVIAFGDSIFHGYGIENNNGVPAQLAAMLGLPLVNHAVNSATLTNVQPDNNICDQVTAATFEGTPLIVLDGGTNDRYVSELSNLGNYGNNTPETIYGATLFIVNYLRAAGVQPWQIVITTPIPSNIRAADKTKVDMQLSIIGFAMYQVGVVSGCNVINGYKTPFNYVDNHYAKQHLMPDDTHPSENGARMYANMIHREIT